MNAPAQPYVSTNQARDGSASTLPSIFSMRYIRAIRCAPISAAAISQLTMVGFHLMNVSSRNTSVMPPRMMLAQKVTFSSFPMGFFSSQYTAICSVTPTIRTLVARKMSRVVKYTTTNAMMAR